VDPSRQEPQKRIDPQAEDGGIRADAQCQRKDGNSNKYRRFLGESKGETQVLPEMSYKGNTLLREERLRIGLVGKRKEDRFEPGTVKRSGNNRRSESR